MTDTDSSLLSRLRNRREASGRRQFLEGALLPLRTARYLLGTPSLWVWVLLPAAINLALFAVVAVLLATNASEILSWIWARPEIAEWYDWLFQIAWYGLFAVFVVGSFVVAYYLVLLVGGAVASPFNDKLSEEAEEILAPDLSDARAGESLVLQIGRSLAVSIGQVMVYLVGLAVLVPLHLVPGIGSLVYTALAACWSAAFLTIEYTDDPLDRRGLSMIDRLRTLRRDLGLAAGFGAGTSLLLVIPVVNLLAMPVAVVAGTALGLALAPSD